MDALSLLLFAALCVFVDALNERLSYGRWSYSLQRAIQTYLGFAVLLHCFVWFVNFVAAVTPHADGRIPAEWSGGVMNHGAYYRWYTIQDRPYFFAVSLVGLVASTAFLI